MRQLLSSVHLMFERQDADRLGDRRAGRRQERPGRLQQQRQQEHSRQHKSHGGKLGHPGHGEYISSFFWLSFFLGIFKQSSVIIKGKIIFEQRGDS